MFAIQIPIVFQNQTVEKLNRGLDIPAPEVNFSNHSTQGMSFGKDFKITSRLTSLVPVKHAKIVTHFNPPNLGWPLKPFQ